MLSEVLTGNLTFKSKRPPDLSCCTKRELREYFENSYELNESLFTALKDESVFYKCPDQLRLPLIFYYGHTAVVYVNKLILAGLMKDRFNLRFETMFETGVDEMSWDDTENYRMGGSYKWPSLKETVEYRRQVRNAVLQIIDDTPLNLPITMDSPWWGLLMGMEHERIHLETSSVLIRQLPVHLVTKPDGWVYAPVKYGGLPSENRMIRVDEQSVAFGKPREFPSYGWDNEYGEVTCKVPSFEASEFLVSNREYLKFVQAGGYNTQTYWTDEGWRWRTYRRSQHPMFWVCNGGCRSGCGAGLASYTHCRFPGNGDYNGDVINDVNGVANGNVSNGYHGESNGYDHVTNGHGEENGYNDNDGVEYKYRAMFDDLDMPWAWPVVVNYHEARAFCAWKGPDYRLLAEAEHNVIRGKQAAVATGTECDVIYSAENSYNHNLVYGSSTPVHMYPANELGFHDVYGNVWQWTEDHFNGLTSATHWLYDDFSSPCYDGRHNLILGGSWVSTGDEASRFARFAFRRHFLQHVGFRVAKTLYTADGTVDLPARLINTEVYILGSGAEKTPNHLDQTRVKPVFVPSANTQYGFERPSALQGILEMEFGFRKSLPVVIANHCRTLTVHHRIQTHRALWIGAGVGRGPFITSETFDKVLATDYCARFLDTAMDIQHDKEVSLNGDDNQTCTASLEPANRPDNITFKQFTWLPNEMGIDFDLTVVTFLERAMQPKAWLLRLGAITKPNGLVVIASPNGSWGRHQLEPTLTTKGLRCVSADEIAYECPDGVRHVTVTAWAHA